MDTSRRERVLTPSQYILIISFLVRIKGTVALSWPACQAGHLFPSSRMPQGIVGALITLLAVKHISTSGSNLIMFAASQLGLRKAQSATPSEHAGNERCYTWSEQLWTPCCPFTTQPVLVEGFLSPPQYYHKWYHLRSHSFWFVCVISIFVFARYIISLFETAELKNQPDLMRISYSENLIRFARYS